VAQVTPHKRLLFAGAIFFGLIAFSVVGYLALGGHAVGFLQALYMAVITVSGVGYGEIVETANHPALRIFNMFIVVFGVATTVYVFSVVTAFIVEVEIANPFWRRRMQKRINEITGHIIVCGLGDTGRHAAQELLKTGTEFVAIESSEEKIKRLKETHPGAYDGLLYVVGDATEEDVLEKAGLSRAKGLITALPQDKDNLVVTVVVRQRYPSLRIIARSASRRFAERILRAGANSTVSPSHIGGLRMASEIIRPNVVGFLDLMLKEQSKTLRVEEVEVRAKSPWAGKSLRELDLHGRYNLLPLALKESTTGKEPKLEVNPPDHTIIQVNAVVIVMGDAKDVLQARSAAAGAAS
jgi:voltage-gated potassium channel